MRSFRREQMDIAFCGVVFTAFWGKINPNIVSQKVILYK